MAGTPTIPTDNDSPGEEPLDQAIAEFLRAEAAGTAGGREQWLARFPACASALAQFFDDREQVDQLLLPVRENVPGPRPTSPPAARKGSADLETVDVVIAAPHFLGDRYRSVRFHAHGGMGEIWLARDERIGRQVAVKKLRAGREDDQGRFQVEAQVTGQLEHPGVVPLHDLGTDASGQPYYVMKFIQGCSLREAIAEYHAQKLAAGRARDLELLRLLETFVSICNAVAYAHSKGVLHRDIKPDNVMLGAFGETLLLDWGLAKIMGEPDVPSESGRRVSPGISTATQDGAIVGSPPYMSPEGAEGRVEAVDQRSDIYLLGATLYEILTGRPPRGGSSRWDLIEQARLSPPAPPRTINRQIPRPLEAICLKSMAFHKHNRYSTPSELAEDVQRYLAGEPVTAYRETPLEKLWRWIRRRRRELMRLGVAAIVLMLTAVVVWNYRSAQESKARVQARLDLDQFRRYVDEAKLYTDKLFVLGESAPDDNPERTLGLLQKAFDIAQSWGERGEEFPLAQERDNLRQERFDSLLLMALATRNYSSNSRALGDALDLIDQAERIHAPTVASSYIRDYCLGRLPRGAGAAALAQPMTDSDHFWRGQAQRLAATKHAGTSGDESTGESRRAALDEAIHEYRQALHLNPIHFQARFELSRCLIVAGHHREAIEALGACIALRRHAHWAYSLRGLAHALAGQHQEAVADLDRALALDPDFELARLHRGYAHWLAGDKEQALKDFGQGLDAPVEGRLIEANYFRGQIFLELDRPEEALHEFSEYVKARPDHPEAWLFRAITYFRLKQGKEGRAAVVQYVSLQSDASSPPTDLAIGAVLHQLAADLAGDARADALAQANAALSSWLARNPGDVEALQQRGAVQQQLGNLDEAIKNYSQALEQDPNHAQLRNMRGWAYVFQEKLEPGRADFEETIRRFPDDPEAHAALGYILARLGDSAAAPEKAAKAALLGSDNYLALHQVACVYGELSTREDSSREKYENLALDAITRAMILAQQHGKGPDELVEIRNEPAFPPSLRARREFELLQSGAAAPPAGK